WGAMRGRKVIGLAGCVLVGVGGAILTLSLETPPPPQVDAGPAAVLALAAVLVLTGAALVRRDMGGSSLDLRSRVRLATASALSAAIVSVAWLVLAADRPPAAKRPKAAASAAALAPAAPSDAAPEPSLPLPAH